jgi:alpha/beta hydrolase family protein
MGKLLYVVRAQTAGQRVFPFLLVLPIAALLLAPSNAEARVVRLRIERREVVLNGAPFGAAGPYEKLVGRVDFGLDPNAPANEMIVDLKLAPRNARGEVESSADFYLLKPVDPRRGNGRLFYEVGNRGGKGMLATFQKAAGSTDPTGPEEFGDGALMRQGFTLLWMGWQWDVPERPGVMRMSMPIAMENGRRITGLVRGNFIPNERADKASVADRNHKAYPVLDPNSAENVMTVRDDPIGKGQVILRSRWRFVDEGTVALDGGFEPGRIYDVVYRTADPRVVGVGLSGTRDLVSFFKYDTSPENPSPGLRFAIGWGVSQSGRFLRHFVYQGFNADEQGRRVFDGVFDQVGGSGRGSFNHRFGQASRDALQYFNILFPVDLFPFADSAETDPETGIVDSILARAMKSGTVPKMFHLLTNSEYFNRAGSLVHTDPTGARDADLPATTRVYMIASAPHGPGPFPPKSNAGGGMVGRAVLNPLNYSFATRALFRALDRWVVDDATPPASAYPRIADGTLTTPDRAGWPAIPGFDLPQQPLRAFHLNFGPDWSRGIVSVEPPEVGTPFVVKVPAVDGDGNVRSGIRLPDIAVPLATQAGWNYRDASIGAADRLAGEIGSYIPFAKTRAERERAHDPRPSIEERYRNRDEYVGRFAAAALELVQKGYVLSEDVADLVKHAAEHYDWAVGAKPTPQP